MRKAKIILHIGHGKTGSTSIQNYLKSRSEQMGDVEYPRLGLNQNAVHHPLFPLGGSRSRQWKDSLATIKRVVDNARDKEAPTVLSSEHLCYFDAESVKELSEVFESTDLEIVYYIRPQVELIESTFKQKIIQNSDYDANFCTWLNNNRNAFDFIKRLAPWISVFGEQRVNLRPYIGGHTDVLEDFSNVLGLKSWASATSIKMRKSLDTRSTRTLLHFDRICPGHLQRSQFISSLFIVEDETENGLDKFVDESLKSEILSFYRQSNEIVYKLFSEKTLDSDRQIWASKTLTANQDAIGTKE